MGRRLRGEFRFAASDVLFASLGFGHRRLLFGQQAQSSALTLPQAVNIALEKNPQRKAALADTRATLDDVREARSFLLPHVTFSETASRGNDPVYVFGIK